MTVILDDGTYSLLRKHYIAMLNALNEIKEMIDCDAEAPVSKIEDIAAKVSTVSLFNPYNRPRYATEEIQKLPSPEECHSPLPVV